MDNHLWLLIHLLALCIMSVSGKVFLSIDCGGSGSFTDENSIKWIGDDDLISNGVTHVVQSNYSISRPYDTLRVFTTRKKNCYSIKVEEGGKVLVRVIFYYGNYDGKSTPPIFDLLFDGNFWITVNSSEVKNYDAIYIVKKNVTSICVAQKNPEQFPFISTIEVRSLDLQMYNNIGTNYALFTNARVAYGIDDTIRFPSDPYDRSWDPAFIRDGLLTVKNNALDTINVDVPNNPPQEVLKNAITTQNTSETITITLNTGDYPIRYPVYINWYFSEVKEHNSTEVRSFWIWKDNIPFSLPITLHYGNMTGYFISNITITPDTSFSFRSVASTLPPLINAAELFLISDVLTDGTNNNDVEGLASLQNAFDVLQEWSGDPCLPVPYSWEWIKCNNDSAPRVTSINLNSFNLSGTLPNFSNMDALEIIDLHNNSLSGPVPEFLGTLPNLKQLNLANNQFSGSVPRSLSRYPNLNLSYTENPLLSSKNKTSKLPIILGITIPVFFIFGAIMVIRHNRRRVSLPPQSEDTSHRANVQRTATVDNFDGKGANVLMGNMEERSYNSDTRVLLTKAQHT